MADHEGPLVDVALLDIFTVCVGGASKYSFSPTSVDACLVFISVAMFCLSHHGIVVGGWLAGSWASQPLFFLQEWWQRGIVETKNVSAVTTRRRRSSSVKTVGPLLPSLSKLTCNAILCWSQQHGSQVSVVSSRATMRVGLGSRDAVGHFPTSQHLGMSRQQPNIAKVPLRCLSHWCTLAEFATRS